MRTIFLSLALLLSFLASFGFGQAGLPVGGRLAGSQVWAAANSPLLVEQNLEIPVGSKLTIGPGTRIELLGHNLVVRGTLIARGTRQQPIVFTSQKPAPAPADWGPITFEGATAGAAFDAQQNYRSGSILEHVRIEYGQGLIFNVGAPYLKNCQIQHNRKERGGGIYAYGCQPKIFNCDISFNVGEKEGGGIRTFNCSPIIQKNRISYNSSGQSGGAISIDYNQAEITNNLISHNYSNYGGGISTGDPQVGQTSMRGTSHSKPTIKDNLVFNNSAAFYAGGIYVEGSPDVTGNLIAGNSIRYTGFEKQPSRNHKRDRKSGTGAGVYIKESYGGPVKFKGNTLVGNRGAWWGGGLFLSRASGVVAQNRFFGNQAVYSGAGISLLLQSQSHMAAHGTSWLISENNFRENQGNTIEFTQGYSKGRQNVSITNCNLEQKSGLLIDNGSNNSVSCSNNWWGISDREKISQLIYDYFNNKAIGPVDFKPSDNKLDLKGLQPIDGKVLEFLASHPGPLRAGQGFNRAPDTPPSVTLAWRAGGFQAPVQYHVHIAKIEPRLGKVDRKSSLRVFAGCAEGTSPVAVGANTKVTLTGFKLGSSYEFFVTAIDDDGNESAPSNCVIVSVER